MKISRTAAGLLAIALLATGCGSGGDDDNGGSSKTGNGATLHMSLSEDVKTLLPMDSNVADNIAVDDVVYDGLVRYDPKTTKPHNYVAQSITTKDNVHWTIKIKPGLKFQNGEPVDAAAFARAWNYAAYGPNAMENNYFFERIKGYDAMQGETDDDGNYIKKPTVKQLSGLKAVNATTLDVTLTGPFAGFSTMLGYTGFFPIAKACLADIKTCAVKPIGNGPFQVTEWNQGESMTLKRWSGYTLNEVPDYSEIDYVEVPGGDDWADFQAGDIDASTPPPEQWEAANNDPDLSTRKVEAPTAALTYIGFPAYLGKPFNDINFRKAISMAIDRQKVIDAILPGQATPADSWVSPTVPGGTKGTCGDACTFNVAEAKKLLAKAGGWPKGKTLYIHLGQDDVQEQYFKAIGDQLKLNLGIPYKLDPDPDFFDNRDARSFHGDGIIRSNWFPDYPLNENYLTPIYGSDDPKHGDDSYGYYDQKFMDDIHKADTAPDLDTAISGYQQAEKVLASDFPTAPLSYSESVVFYSDRLSNVVLDPFSGAVKLRLVSVSN
ncbi:ABC transporter substrate-binding protein [Nocardioides sp. KR10-350]|uniref:peptide ABC transporter substrate-binding protein n=1 Tax=Nocardioides cheoyonin TaxID=3156615 RepID=UPI0032B4496D